MKLYINDTRPLKAKLADLSNDSLIDDMIYDFEDYSRYIDPYKVMSYNWRWNRWLRNK